MPLLQLQAAGAGAPARLCRERPEAERDLKHPKFGTRLSRDQFFELWAVLPSDARGSFASLLLAEVRTPLTPEDLVALLR